MAASNTSPQFPPLNEQVPQHTRSGIDIPLDRDMPEPQLSRSPVAGHPCSDNCLGLFNRVDVDAPQTWAQKKLVLCPRI